LTSPVSRFLVPQKLQADLNSSGADPELLKSSVLLHRERD